MTEKDNYAKPRIKFGLFVVEVNTYEPNKLPAKKTMMQSICLSFI